MSAQSRSSWLKMTLKILGNKYVLTTIGFIAWTVYFDQNDLLSLRERQRELDNVKGNIDFLNKDLAQMNAEKVGLLHDRHKLEEYARENYHMKRDNEDIYVIDNGTAVPATGH